MQKFFVFLTISQKKKLTYYQTNKNKFKQL